MKSLAKFISIILGPAVLWPVTLFLFIQKTNSDPNKIISQFLVLIILQIIIPLGYIVFAYKKKSVHDLELFQRKERYFPLVLALISLLISLVFVKFFGNPQLFNFMLITTLLLAINTFVTFFWKISLHMALNIIAAFFINKLFANQLWIIYLSIPLVFWSRLYLKKHTVAELVSAFVLNVAVLLFLSLTFKHLFNFG